METKLALPVCGLRAAYWKIGPPSKISHPLLLNKVVATGAFLLKADTPVYGNIHAVMLSKKHQRSSTVQQE